MPGQFGGGFDDGKRKVRIIGTIMLVGFVLWFLYEGLSVVTKFQN